MKALEGFWQFLNTDVKDIPWGDVAEQGIEALKSLPDAAKAWQENADKVQQLAPYFQQAEPLLKALDDPIMQLAIAGLPFVSIGINLLKIGLELAKVDPTFESSVAIVAQLAYLQSLEMVLQRLQDEEIKSKLAQLSFEDVVQRQLARLDTTELTTAQAKRVTTQFRESVLAQEFDKALAEQLQQVGLEDRQAQRLVDQVVWGSHRYLHQAIVEAGESVAPLAEFYRTGGQREQERFASIDEYLEKIKSLPLEQVFDESDPKVTIQDIYVRLEVQPLDQEGEVKEDVDPIRSHEWTQQILEQPANQTRKVMFIEGEAGRGKSVFCRMIANWVRNEFGDAFIPLLIRLRDLRSLGQNLTETLKNCPDLQSAQFVQSKSDWLADKNIRFLIILDGFDELLLQARESRDIKDFLEYVIDFQKNFHHQCLVTGRPLALQGLSPVIMRSEYLERVRLEAMGDPAREQWLTQWQTLFGEKTVTTFRQFLDACPEDITNTLAREPLLLYLLARLNRENYLNHEMFADTQTGANQQTQAKLQIYRKSVDWVLENQRQDENQRQSGLELEDLREVLQEAALCVVQSGNETARLEMVKQRFTSQSNPIAKLLEQAKTNTGQTEKTALKNLLTTFYLKPGEEDKRGSVEFTHKSFGEYLFAERLIAAFKYWTEVDDRKQPRVKDDKELYEQIYDLLGYGGLSQEIVAYLWELLEESEIDRIKLFNQLHGFYEDWCQGEFLDAPPNENLPQKKLLQLLEQKIPVGLKRVDVFTGLNVMIILFKLHASAQPEGYPHLPKDSLRSEIWFHPCGEPDTEDFKTDQLLKIIHYADALSPSTFATTVGPHLAKANLTRANLTSAFLATANLYSANLYSANLDNAILYRAILESAFLDNAFLANAFLANASLYSANLVNANLYSANLHSAILHSAILYGAILESANLVNANLYGANLESANLVNATLRRAILIETNLNTLYSLSREQLEGSEQFKGEDSPLICNAALPPNIKINPNRDWDRLATVLHKRYPSAFETLKDAEKWVEKRRPN